MDFNETTGKGSVGAVELANMRMIAVFAAALAMSGFTGSARAQAIIDFTQVRSNVDVTLSASINTSGLEYDGVTELYGSEIIPDQGTIAFNFSG